MARILVIDDQAHIRTIIEEFLTIERHTVDLAENGKVGMKMVGLNGYDLVISDVIMPEQDGLAVIVELKTLHPFVKIIAMTGGIDSLDIADIMDTSELLGADRVLSKPLDYTKLQAAVNEVLGSDNEADHAA
jgi:DNA-binding response OmpR family regulator